MSLDLAPKKLVATTATAITTAWPTLANLGVTAGSQVDCDTLSIKVNTTAGDITIAYTDLGFSQGTKYVFAKTSTDTNKLIFVDPLTGVTLGFVDRQGEEINLVQTATGVQTNG